MTTKEVEEIIKESIRKTEESKPQPNTMAYILANDKEFYKRYSRKTMPNPYISKEDF